jgi:iron complex transport system substrate-binding protein
MIPILFFAALTTLIPSGQEVIYDDLRTPLALGPPPQRIISLAPNITEILFELGLGRRTVGVTRYCDYPPEALAIDKIGGMVDPNLEKIQSLRPDLIIGFRGNPLRVLTKLRSLRFPVFVLNLGSSLEGLFQTIEMVGRVSRAEDSGGRLVSRLKADYEAIRLALHGISRRPKVFLSVYGQGLWTCGQGSYLDDLLARAGGVNIAGRVKRRWLQLNREQLIHENPDVIIVMAKDERLFSQAAGAFRTDPRLKDIRAVKDNNIRWLDENIAGRFGPRLMGALDTVARILHPEKFENRR